MLKSLCLTILFCLASCASNEAPRQQHQVDCKYWLQQCHLKARNHCRRGYSVVRSVRMDRVGGPQGSYKAYKMLFTCN